MTSSFASRRGDAMQCSPAGRGGGGGRRQARASQHWQAAPGPPGWPGRCPGTGALPASHAGGAAEPGAAQQPPQPLPPPPHHTERCRARGSPAAPPTTPAPAPTSRNASVASGCQQVVWAVRDSRLSVCSATCSCEGSQRYPCRSTAADRASSAQPCSMAWGGGVTPAARCCGAVGQACQARTGSRG